jgi:hypothetical protein
VRGGVGYGATDELGFKAVDKPTYSYDFHATALHLLGIDHTKLTWYPTATDGCAWSCDQVADRIKKGPPTGEPFTFCLP